MDSQETTYKLKTKFLGEEYSLFIIVDALRDGRLIRSFISDRLTTRNMPYGLPHSLLTPENLNKHL